MVVFSISHLPVGSTGSLFWHITVRASLVRAMKIMMLREETEEYAVALEGFSEALSKELPPSWNIHITIIEPGGFRTAWKEGNVVEPEQHPAYAGPDTPSSKYREMLNAMEFIGDPKKGSSVPLTCYITSAEE